MEIELKSIRFFERMSEETNAFRASLYIDGKPVGEAGNDGKGGPTWYRAAHPDYWPLIKNAEEYCKTLPPFVFGKGTPEQFEVPSDLQGVIDDLFEQHLIKISEKKYNDKMKKAMLTGIVFGTENEYKCLVYRDKQNKKVPISAVYLSNRSRFEQDLNKVKAGLKPGERILNTNIPEELL